MTHGIGGSDAVTELDRLQDMSAGATPIGDAEYARRLQRAPRRPLLYDGKRTALVYPAGPFCGRPFRAVRVLLLG
ncbi:MAG: hypothetical protein NWR12_07860 [Haliea sp.]|jgi:hypothetical protein|nr:hypothetical protein [Haliea sp.]MDP4917619.1 hypothetical protein [Haliea sp.]MDP5065573.1 hypothetical protein [Haliea sp.]